MSNERADPERFSLPVDQIRSGLYTDAYFNLAKRLLEETGRDPVVTMQVFGRKHALLAGIDEAVAVLRTCSGHRGDDGHWRDGWERLRVSALAEGTRVEPWETVMLIEGPYSRFAHLETVYLGCLARRTRVATNVAEVAEAAAGKPIYFFPARHDHYPVQAGDGWAAHVAGTDAVSTDAQASWWGGRGLGTVPHALIAAFGGDTVAAAEAFAAMCAGDDVDVIVLVDFVNDSARTAVEVADALGDDLWGVRLDTSGSLVDRSLWEEMGSFDPTGVNPRLCREVRAALDRAGHERVRIVVSGGFDAAKVRDFERAGAPVDVYGVGSALLRGSYDFTADVVELEGRPCAKAGRRLRPNPRLEPVR